MNERIVFLGTPAISAKVLKGLVEAGFNIVGVVTKEDKVRSRNGKPEESPVAKMAAALGLPCHKPHRLNKDYEFVKDLQPDLLLTFSFGQLISDDVLALSKFTPLNLHGSLLPRYRGASPMQTALRNGDDKTGVSLMAMVHEMDAGDVYAQKEIPLTLEDNYTSLCDKMADAALALAVEELPNFFAGTLKPIAQDINKVVVTHMISKEDEHLDLNQDNMAFINQVRSLSEEPGAYLLHGEEIIKIFKAEPYSENVTKEIGSLSRPSKKVLTLQLAHGEVRILELQRPGKKKMSAMDFLNGVKDVENYHLR